MGLAWRLEQVGGLLRLSLIIIRALLNGIFWLEHCSLARICIGDEEKVVFSCVSESILIELGCDNGRFNSTCSFDPAFEPA